MLIASIVIAWIACVVFLSIRAMRSAVEPPIVECFDCDRQSCAGCPYLEREREEASWVEEEERLAA